MPNYQANHQNVDNVLKLIKQDVYNNKGVTSITTQDFRPGSKQQHKGYWVLIGQIKKWLNNNGIKYEFGAGNKKFERDFTSDDTHELIMYSFFPTKNGKRMSLTQVIKDKEEMCNLISKLMAGFAERGLILTLDSDNDFGYYDWIARQEQ